MTNFNTLLTFQQIVHAYKNNEFPDAYCLLFNGVHEPTLLTAESVKTILNVVTQENKKGLEVEGYERTVI